MPTIIDYPSVLQQMEARGFRSLYHNGGAFGFAPGADVHVAGWVGPPDESIRPDARRHVRHVEPPYEERLARGAIRVWIDQIGGAGWMMPMSHWSYELDFGSREWLAGALTDAGLDATRLAPRANGAAIEFSTDESEQLCGLLAQLLRNLRASDFMLAFPGKAVLCTVHHHKQLWWQTTDEALHGALTEMLL